MPVGSVVWIQRTPSRGASCEPLSSASLREDWGIEGDRHARPASSRQVVLVAAEVLDDLSLPYGATREQLTVAGLADLRRGDVVEIGDARVELVRLRVPCRVMEGVRIGLERELDGRGGWCGRVLSSGEIRVGDAVAVASDRSSCDPEWVDAYLRAIAEWEASPPQPAVAGEWGFPERLAHLIAWDERAATRIAALAAGAADEQWGPTDIDAFNAEAVARLLTEAGERGADHLWVVHDSWSTAVVDAARRHPAHAESWVRGLTTHYREHC